MVEKSVKYKVSSKYAERDNKKNINKLRKGLISLEKFEVEKFDFFRG